MRRTIVAILAALVLAPFLATADETAARQDRAEAYASEIIDMRRDLAREFIKPGVEITQETFMQVCGAVGKRVKEISEKEGFEIRHAAVKYRNPANKATGEETELIESFVSDEDGIIDEWEMIERGGKNFFRYTAPIYVEKQCLACHGLKDERPQFIVEKYPEDKAYGFKSGDLRGIISILFEAK